MAKRAAVAPPRVSPDASSGRLDVAPAGAGMHLVGQLTPGEDYREVSERAARRGVEASAGSLYGASSDRRGGTLLGYAAVGEAGIREGVRRLAEAME